MMTVARLGSFRPTLLLAFPGLAPLVGWLLIFVVVTVCTVFALLVVLALVLLSLTVMTTAATVGAAIN